MSIASILLENEGWLRAVVFSRLGDRLATEDVLQEICLAALICDQKKQEVQEPRGWLYQVAIKQVLLFRRGECRRRNKLERFAVQNRTHDSVSAAGKLCSDESCDQVKDSLELIRPSDRQVLVMKYTEGMSCRQIAERLGVKESTIQSRLLRARRRLRKVLEEKGGFEDLSYVFQQ